MAPVWPNSLGDSYCQTRINVLTVLDKSADYAHRSYAYLTECDSHRQFVSGLGHIKISFTTKKSAEVSGGAAGLIMTRLRR